MPPSPEQPPLDLPTATHWADLGLEPGQEIDAGHQSRVFRARSRTGPVVAKLVDPRLADAGHVNRVGLVAMLAELDDAVVGPLPLGEDLVVEIGSWLLSVYPDVGSASPDDRDPNQVRAMAETMAGLHRSMAALQRSGGPGAVELAPVAALEAVPEAIFDNGQLIHGDFAASNLVVGSDGLRVIDLDGCGTASTVFDVGNTLYMADFDGWSSGDAEHAGRFRSEFVASYRRASGQPLDEDRLDLAIQVRRVALAHWLDHPDRAPIGLQRLAPTWRRKLRAYLRARANDTSWR